MSVTTQGAAAALKHVEQGFSTSVSASVRQGCLMHAHVITGMPHVIKPFSVLNGQSAAQSGAIQSGGGFFYETRSPQQKQRRRLRGKAYDYSSVVGRLPVGWNPPRDGQVYY